MYVCASYALIFVCIKIKCVRALHIGNDWFLDLVFVKIGGSRSGHRVTTYFLYV